MRVAPPAGGGHLPAAFARQDEDPVDFRISEDGLYALGYTPRETKAWKMPEGRLIYRFQSGQLAGAQHGIYSNQIRGFYITADGRYVYPTTSAAGRGYALEAADLATGQIVPPGPLLDSLKDDRYEARFHSGDPEMAPTASNPFVQKRDYDNGGRAEGVEIIGSAGDLLHPGQRIICYKQEHCGSKEWIKEHTIYTVKELRKKQ